jgi:hypothetical protein
VDDALRHLVRDLQRVPLALMLATSLPADLEHLIDTLDYVEQDRLTDVPTDHLAGRTKDIDFQLWIAREGEPCALLIPSLWGEGRGEGKPCMAAVPSSSGATQVSCRVTAKIAAGAPCPPPP